MRGFQGWRGWKSLEAFSGCFQPKIKLMKGNPLGRERKRFVGSVLVFTILLSAQVHAPGCHR